MIMLAITAQCLYTFGPALPTNFSKKSLILLSNLGPNLPSLIYFKFNKYILYSTYRQELQILLRLTYCIPCKHKITTFINILVINIHYDQGQSNFDGGYFFLSTHCRWERGLLVGKPQLPHAQLTLKKINVREIIFVFFQKT